MQVEYGPHHRNPLPLYVGNPGDVRCNWRQFGIVIEEITRAEDLAATERGEAIWGAAIEAVGFNLLHTRAYVDMGGGVAGQRCYFYRDFDGWHRTSCRQTWIS